jgi:iron complex outermembrane receptor protein
LKKYVRANTIVASGRVYTGWKYLSDNDGNGDIHSPYLQLGLRFGRCTLQAGVKYFYYAEPASTAYRGSAAAGTPYSYDDALDHNLGEDVALSLDKMTYDEWLPSLALGYQWSDNLELYANYGRNYMRPYAYVPVATIYTANRARFQAAGMTLQDILDDWKIETSDNIDVGVRYYGDWFELHPAIFFARHHDLLAVVYDPLAGVDYHQNVGDVTAVGAELAVNFYPTDNLLVFANPSYTRMRFDDDLVRGGSTVHLEGKQLPDTPEMLFKTGLVYTLGNLEIAPTFKYVGRRYGDPQNDQPISPHGLVDLSLRYTRKNIFFLRSLTAELAVSNLFDRKYVGSIAAQDDGSGSAYYAGAPFSAVFSLQAVF